MMPPRLKLAYAGSPLLSSLLLEALVNKNRHDVGLLLTQPDRRSGRGKKISCNPAKRCAKRLGIPVLQPASSAEIEAEQLAQFDLLLVIAYGMILPPHILSSPAYGCINVHFSLLPRWRGAAPIQHAILAGDRKSGISIMKMDARLDAGPLYLTRSCPIEDHDNSGMLEDRLTATAETALHHFLDLFSKEREIPAHTQDEAAATYAGKLLKKDAKIDWRMPAQKIDRKIRAFNPSPVTHSSIDGQIIRIWAAQLIDTPNTKAPPGTLIHCDKKNGIVVMTGAGSIKLLQLQSAGKRVMSAVDFLHGRPDLIAHHARFDC